MLHIDRVQTEMEVLPEAEGRREPGARASVALLNDPAFRERLRAVVLEILRDHVRQLERQGDL